MNVKEIAVTAGRKERCVRNWVVKAAAKSASIAAKSAAAGHGKSVDYDVDETLAIIEAGMGKNAADIWRVNSANATLPKVQGLPIPNEKVESVLTEKDIQLIATVVSMTVKETVKSLDSRMTTIEQHYEARAALLPAPQIKPRDHISQLVRKHACDTGSAFPDTWSKLYREFGYRTNTNPSVSAKNRGMTIIDYIETEGQIETLESVAVEIFA